MTLVSCLIWPGRRVGVASSAITGCLAWWRRSRLSMATHECVEASDWAAGDSGGHRDRWAPGLCGVSSGGMGNSKRRLQSGQSLVAQVGQLGLEA
uniref:Uncharacterized protein n=1 Tax=Leersia perrieri TaxID=77586 RepID=A0A0D9WPW6_9ORYZ